VLLVKALPRRPQLGLQRGQERKPRSRELLGRLLLLFLLLRCTCRGPCRRCLRLRAGCCAGCTRANDRSSSVPRTELDRRYLPRCGLRRMPVEPWTDFCTVTFRLVGLAM